MQPLLVAQRAGFPAVSHLPPAPQQWLKRGSQVLFQKQAGWCMGMLGEWGIVVWAA